MGSAGVFWTTNHDDGQVLSCAIGGAANGSPTVLASGLDHRRGIALNETSIFWTSHGSGQVFTCAIGAGCAGTPTPLASGAD